MLELVALVPALVRKLVVVPTTRAQLVTLVEHSLRALGVVTQVACEYHALARGARA